MRHPARCVGRVAALAAALALLVLSSADAVRTQSVAPGRVIWRGVMMEMTSSPACEEQLVQTFEFEGDEHFTGTTWRSRKVTWNQSLTCAKEVLMLVDTDGDPTTPPRRMWGPWGGSCENSGEADLQTTPDPSVRSRCQETPRLGYVNPRKLPTLGWTGPRPDDQMRDGCAFNSRSRTLGSDGTVGFHTVSVTVSRGQPDAVVEVDRREYDAFVPEPGKTLMFAARSARPARFRFELEREGTSRFPGYATNANVDDAFFLKHNLTHLRGRYANDGADMIFDPDRFESGGWSRRDLHFVETRTAETSALVLVTAMDYGAVGRLRAYVESADCGGSWQPIPISIDGQRRDALDLPLDADNNLIADALEPYRGLDSGVDDDAEPKGNGMAGDGLTAFEEYRGFLVRGASCAGPLDSPGLPEPGLPAPEPFPDEEQPSGIPGWDDEHMRTTPRHKNLFVHTADPELVPIFESFAWASGLLVHAICEPHYVDNQTRIVNHTLQRSGARAWRGRTLSQGEPQHGLWVLPVDETTYGSLGTAIPVVTGTSGPPKFTSYIEIRKPPSFRGQGRRIRDAIERTNRSWSQRSNLAFVLVHELGHAVGLTHHGDRVENWRDIQGRLNVTPDVSPRQRAGGPVDYSRDYAIEDFPDQLIVDPGPECLETDESAAFMNGRFAGCLTTEIARRGQQNSGDMECPMRYAFGGWYEPPNASAVFRYSGVATLRVQPTETDPAFKVDAWGGPLRRYRDDLDRLPRGRLCASLRGTEINALPGHLNHAGDAGRDRTCADQIVINDVAAPGMPR
jgi:hypothetical protein